MAGMFYSLQEAVVKLRKTKEQVEELVRSGRLREFRDGANLLFKIDEVEALMSDTSVMRSEQPSEPPEAPIEEDEQILLQPQPSEPPEAPITEDELTAADSTAVAGEAIDTAEETDIDSRTVDDAKTDTSGQPSSDEEISLEAEPTETAAADESLTDADTVVAGKETEAIGTDDSEYKMADDMMGETKAGSGEALLEEIEEDVNLDSFGSGSGLLDLSLQADDTSLGGVLDEIYTPEGEQDQQVGKEPEMEVTAEPEQELAEGSSVADVELAVPAVAQAYIEPEPDTLSNSLGIMLFLPLLAVVYTTIVTVAGFNDVMPAILQKVQGIIWYIVIALAVAAALIVGMPFMLGGKTGKAAKPKAKRKKKKAKDAAPPEPEAKNA